MGAARAHHQHRFRHRFISKDPWVIVLKPRLKIAIVTNSVIRYLQIDLKYKFLLFSDVIWLMLDVVAFAFLGGMVDAAVEPNEYYNDFLATDHGDYIEIDIYDSFGNSYFGDADIDSYIREEGTLKPWEEWATGNKAMPTGSNASILIDDKAIANYLEPEGSVPAYEDGAFNIPSENLGPGLHFIEIKFKDVDRTGVSQEEKKTFSSSFFVGSGFADPNSSQLYVNTVSYTGNGDVWLQISNGHPDFDLNQGKFKLTLDGETEMILSSTTNHRKILLMENNTVEIKDLERIDGALDKGEHTITFKFTPEGSNITYIGKKTFLVATEEWQNNDLGIDYSLTKFFLIGVLFWAFFGKAYEDTVNTIPDEAARGTIGFLITNNVNLLTLLISRYISSSIKTFIIAAIFVFPIIAYQDIANLLWPGAYPDSVFGGFDPADIPSIMLVLLMMWIFMLVFSLLISSLNIMFKRILPFAMMMLAGLKVLTGYYFPLEALEVQLEALGGLADMIKDIPLVNGVYLIREIIVGKDVDIGARLGSMLRGTIYLGIVSIVVYVILEKKSRKWGTLEFY